MNSLYSNKWKAVPQKHKLPRRRISPARRELTVPLAIATGGDRAVRCFREFFRATGRHQDTRAGYYRAVCSFFAWLDRRGVGMLADVEPDHVATYLETLKTTAVEAVGETAAKVTVKQHLAGIRILFDWLVCGEVLALNPARAVREPKQGARRTWGAALTTRQMLRVILDRFDFWTVTGLRDRALIGIMVYALASVPAVVRMRVEDYYLDGNRRWIRLHEHDGTRREMPAGAKLEGFIEEYLAAAGIPSDGKSPLFPSIEPKSRQLSERPMGVSEVNSMIRRRTAGAALKMTLGGHAAWTAGDRNSALDEVERPALLIEDQCTGW